MLMMCRRGEPIDNHVASASKTDESPVDRSPFRSGGRFTRHLGEVNNMVGGRER